MVGTFWDHVRAEFPTVRTVPRIQTPIETPGTPLPPQPIQFAPDPIPLARTWLETSDRKLLIQIQDDRYLHNWRRGQQPYAPYPHFEELLDRFVARWNEYSQFLQSHLSLPPPSIIQVEVSYINWFVDLAPEDFLRPAAAAHVDVPGVSPMPHGQSWTAFYHVMDGNQPIGRLYVQGLPATRNEPPEGPGMQFALTVRIPCAGQPESEIPQHLLRARSAIVRSFDELTTATAHSNWGRFT